MFLDVTWLEKPKIFISSTMDKVTLPTRIQITDELRKMGYEVLAFETNSFPYANDYSTGVIEETVNAVAKANVFVMILDENFGTVIDSKSVIQREYQRAKELKIPTYVFIQKDVWKDFIDKKVESASFIKTKEHFSFLQAVSEFKIAEYTTANECIEHLNNQLLNFLGGALRFSTKAAWLWNENYTRSIEKNANEVWIITPDFMWDYNDTQFRAIVTNNVTNRKCKYKYIYSANNENKLKQKEMMRYYSKVYEENHINREELDKQVQFIDVKPDKFFWSCEQIIFNPFALNERAIMVDVMDVRDRTLKFNVEFGHGKRVFFREQFISYWNSHLKGKTALIDPNQY